MTKHHFLSIVLTIALLFSASMAESVDLSAMTDQELTDLKGRIVRELEARNPVQPVDIRLVSGRQTMLVNEDGIKIYLTGRYSSTWKNEAIILGTAFENESGQALSAWMKDAELNGWVISGGAISSTIRDGQKKASDLTIPVAAAMITDLSELKDLTFWIGMSDESYKEVRRYGPFRILFGRD